MDARSREKAIEANVRENWFAEHVATRLDENSLEWKQPGTIMFKINYVIAHGILFVTGDIGEACYRCRGGITFESLAGWSLDAFHRKCTASENGRGHMEWSEEVALHHIEDMLQTYAEAVDDETEEQAKERALEAWRESGGKYCLSSEFEWNQWLGAAHDADDIFGANWVEWVPKVGSVISHRCIGHLVGIKMAMEQLAEKAEEEAINDEGNHSGSDAQPGDARSGG